MNTIIEARAIAAYYRKPLMPLEIRDQHSDSCSYVTEHKGLKYAVVANNYRTLAVYRVRTVNGKMMLKGMKRFPVEVAEAY